MLLGIPPSSLFTAKDTRLFLSFLPTYIDESLPGLFRSDEAKDADIDELLQGVFDLIRKYEKDEISLRENVDNFFKKLVEEKKLTPASQSQLWTTTAKRILTQSQRLATTDVYFIAPWRVFYEKLRRTLELFESVIEPKNFTAIPNEILIGAFQDFMGQLTRFGFEDYVASLHEFIYLVKKCMECDNEYIDEPTSIGLIVGGVLALALRLQGCLNDKLPQSPLSILATEKIFMGYMGKCLISSGFFNKPFDRNDYTRFQLEPAISFLLDELSSSIWNMTLNQRIILHPDSSFQNVPSSNSSLRATKSNTNKSKKKRRQSKKEPMLQVPPVSGLPLPSTDNKSGIMKELKSKLSPRERSISAPKIKELAKPIPPLTFSAQAPNLAPASSPGGQSSFSPSRGYSQPSVEEVDDGDNARRTPRKKS